MTAEKMSYDVEAARAGLERLAEERIGPRAKGFAGLGEALGATPRELVGVTVGSGADPFSTPLLTLRASAIASNIARMAEYCARRGALVAPHAKTTMSPEIFIGQLEAGAWALTGANVTQARVFAFYGARRIIIANEVTDPVALRSLRALLVETPGLDLYCYVDSVRGVELLDEQFRGEIGAAPRVLIEVGLPDARTGVRSVESAVEVARAVAATENIRVAGASCFEGSLGDRGADERGPAVREILALVRETGERLSDHRLVDDGLVLSGGGSHHFDEVIDEFARCTVEGTRIVVRSGSYVVHDHGVYLDDSPALRGAALSPFVPAIELRAIVLSRPDTQLVLVNAGRRDVSFDEGYPVVLGATRQGEAVDVAGAAVVGLNDQHAFVRMPVQSDLAVGDTMTLGISHPCTTFDKWTHGVLIDDDDVVTGIAHMFF